MLLILLVYNQTNLDYTFISDGRDAHQIYAFRDGACDGGILGRDDDVCGACGVRGENRGENRGGNQRDFYVDEPDNRRQMIP